MADKYKLFCEYTHCCGKQRLELGTADTVEKALQWKKSQTLTAKRPRLQENDLVLTCPVKSCPGKIQVPRYDYSACTKEMI